MKSKPSNQEETAILVGMPAEFLPPFSDERRDAELEALRFAFTQLVMSLAEAGLLDRQALCDHLVRGEVCHFSEQPMLLASLRNLRYLLGCPHATPNLPTDWGA